MGLWQWLRRGRGPRLPGAQELSARARERHARGDLDGAIADYEAALALEPGHFGATIGLAAAWRASGDPERALRQATRAIGAAPERAEGQLLLAELLLDAGRVSEAVQACRVAAALEPRSASVLSQLGSSLLAARDLEAAHVALERAVSLEPAHAAAHFNLGIVSERRGDERAALEAFSRAADLDPGLAQAHLNAGYLLERRADPEAAIAAYRRAIGAAPLDAEAHLNLSLQLLLTGRFEEGWQEYEWRWRLPGAAPPEPFAGAVRWQGEDLGGGTLLLRPEQGLGDTVQFSRFAAQAAQRGCRVLLQCVPALAELMASVEGVTAVTTTAVGEDEVDAYCPLLSLPGVLGAGATGFASRVPYLHPPEARIARWRDRIGARGAGMRVGLIWATQSGTSTAADRSLPLESFAALAGIPSVSLHSLQVGAPAQEALASAWAGRMADHSAQLTDFSETAALMASLDLVISIDTSGAHLAGALGLPVWVLDSFPPEWRWGLEGDCTPWYPTMRLFRRVRGESWRPVIERVAQALAGQVRDVV